ncbi:RAD52 motif-containing protein 1-like isoform X10 [Panthera onca]
MLLESRDFKGKSFQRNEKCFGLRVQEGLGNRRQFCFLGVKFHALTWRGTTPQHSLFAVFSQFGLLYSVRVFPNAAVARPGFYAIIKFYSARDAHRAQKACDQKQLFQNSPVKVVLPSYECRSPGAGMAEETLDDLEEGPLSFLMKRRTTQKLAIQKAVSDAFQKLLIVILESGKIAVEYRPCEEITDASTEDELQDLIQGPAPVPHSPGSLHPGASACHVPAAPVGPTASLYVATVVAAGPGSSASGVGPGPCPADFRPPGGG